MKQMILFLALLCLASCIGYARGDGQGNVEVVTNFGKIGDIPGDEDQIDTDEIQPEP